MSIIATVNDDDSLASTRIIIDSVQTLKTSLGRPYDWEDDLRCNGNSSCSLQTTDTIQGLHTDFDFVRQRSAIYCVSSFCWLSRDDSADCDFGLFLFILNVVKREQGNIVIVCAGCGSAGIFALSYK